MIADGGFAPAAARQRMVAANDALLLFARFAQRTRALRPLRATLGRAETVVLTLRDPSNGPNPQMAEK
jgi:hypothetical protein